METENISNNTIQLHKYILWRFVSLFQYPSVVAVVDHLLCHTAVDADVFSGDKSGFVGTKEQHHICYVLRVADSPGGVLRRVRPSYTV